MQNHLRKNRILTDFAYIGASFWTSVNYRVQYVGSGNLAALREKGFVLVANHQSQLDILLEGTLLKRSIDRQGYYIMKDRLPKVLEYIGGIPIIRTKDIREAMRSQTPGKATDGPGRAQDRNRLRQINREAIERRRSVDAALAELLRAGQIVVIHPQGERAYHAQFRPDLRILSRLLRIQQDNGTRIDFVPLTISYEGIRKYNSRIIVEVGRPFSVSDQGVDELARRLQEAIRPRQFQGAENGTGFDFPCNP